MIELLAPAKDKICAKAAIDYGADAVYIGAEAFGARKAASNPIEDIKEVVEYAHKYWAKVYVTVNTILTDDELVKSEKLIQKLSDIGVDAVIIQDMGLLEAVKKSGIYPHASTQCDNRTVEKVKFLENVGFKRVVLARELSIEQIKEIKNQTNVELESFIHGALCVSYSGQCYLSQAIGGKRSANRGECAQPCRKKYSIVDEEGNSIAKDKYLLCLKDFNASKYIKELAVVGVTSFKIEGRLKDVNYVKNVVAYYRKIIDDLGLKKSSSGSVTFDFEPDLYKSFNRGFTDYFLSGKRSEIYSFDSPKSRGEYIGKVSKTGKDFFEIKTDGKIYPQDGLCFLHKNESSGCLVNKVVGSKIYPNSMEGIKVGTEIYRNFDYEFEKKLNSSKTFRKIGINIEFSLGKIIAIDEDGVQSEIEYKFDELAQNEEKMRVNVINQLKKSGDSIFEVNEVNIKTNKIPFLPVSKLNELRRDLLENLTEKRCKDAMLQRCTDYKNGNINYPQPEIDYRGNVLNEKAREFYESHGCKVTEPALESAYSSKLSRGGKTVMSCKHCLKYAFGMCKSAKKLYLIDEKGKKYSLKFNCDKCEMEIIY